VFLLLSPAADSGTAVGDWAKSPEAYFLTAEERAAWKTLASDSARADFQAAYWRRRDPTPDTPRNEFKQKVLARIRAADERFTSGKQIGSQTARGLATVVLGIPAIERQTVGPLKPALVKVVPGRMGLSPEAFHSTEWHVWEYNRERNRELLEELGRPSAEVTFVIERGRPDQMQSFRQFAPWQEALAQRSIVSP
jgi:GWxTD domain-containing protein